MKPRVGGSGNTNTSWGRQRPTQATPARLQDRGRNDEQKPKTTSRDTRTPYGLRASPKPTFKGTGSAKSAKGDGEVPEGSSGWATVKGATRLPYLLDTEATSSIIPETVFNILQARAQVELETLVEQPIRIVQVDGSAILVNRIAKVDTVLETEAGPYDLGQVAFRVLPGEGG